MIRAGFGLVIASCLTAGTLGADDIADCHKAIADNDRTTALFLAQTMLVLPPASSPDVRDRAVQCLAFAFDEPYRFDNTRNAYIADRRPEQSQPAEGRARAEAMVDELSARISEHEAKVRQSKIEAQVLERATAACEKLYLQDPDLAVTNNVCVDIFLRTGLPN